MIDSDFDEVNESQFPAVELLVKLGWKYLSREEADEARNGDRRKVILTNIAKDALMHINDYDGRKFDEPDIAGKVDELENTEFNGLIDTCREISGRIMPKLGGGTIKVFENGAYQDRSIRYFDFDNPENNDYHVTVEYKVDGNEENLRADIVLFINGIPIAEIENKKSSVGYKKAIDQLHRYQQKEYSPKMYTFLQLLIAMDCMNAVYGTADTPDEFFVSWREKTLGTNKVKEKVEEILSGGLNSEDLKKIKQDLNGCVRPLGNRKFIPQDELIYGMLRKDRILDIIRNFVFYDGLHKKVARYQQYFAVKKTLSQIKTMDPKNPNRRKGGIIWHTQGSGKSLTMVMLVRALIEDEEIDSPRVIIVTDRIDLDKQIKGTFENAGLKKNIVRTVSGEDLLRRIQEKDDSVLTKIIDKFNSASNRGKRFVDEDKNIFVLIDEAHRSQSGDANLKMLQMIPNACYVAFTGTPLLKKQKTENKFGEFIDKYTIDDALADKVIVPLIYEGRFVSLEQDVDAINRKSERILRGLDDSLRKKLADNVEKNTIRGASTAIEEICYDISEHYERVFQNTGLKAQIVAPNKKAALEMQKWFERVGDIKTALVISDENGEISSDDEDRIEVKEYLDKIKHKYSNLKSYEDGVISDFKDNPKGIEIIIVVDKLLTGFDAPRNTVLYLAKPLKDHNLLQAIARVNRVYSNKNQKIDKTAGFVIDYSANAAAIKEAMALFGNFDPDDVHGTLIDPAEKKEELERKYQEVLELFRGKGCETQEDYIEYLRDDASRREFEDKFNSLLAAFSEYSCLRDVDSELTNTISRDLKKLSEIKRSARLQFGDYVDLRQYERELARILNQHITAKEAETLIEPIDINNSEEFKKAIEQLETNKSRAEAIAAQTQRRITEIFKMHGDEVLWKKFSDKIQSIIDALREEKIADIEALKQLSLISDEISARKDNDLPERIKEQPGADIVYRNLRDVIANEDYAEHVLNLSRIVCENSVIDWWKNYDQKRVIENYLDDYIYDNMNVSEVKNKEIREKVLELAENNHDLFRS